jgi:hypothetical protein
MTIEIDGGMLWDTGILIIITSRLIRRKLGKILLPVNRFQRRKLKIRNVNDSN